MKLIHKFTEEQLKILIRLVKEEIELYKRRPKEYINKLDLEDEKLCKDLLIKLDC